MDNGVVKTASHHAVEKAVACGMEITVACGNQRVDFTVSATNASSGNKTPDGILRNLLPSLGGIFRAGPVKQGPVSPLHKSAPPVVEENFAFLNVHAGVSTGLMAGIDIGANDRWEFFLVGEPLTKVAVAEGLAALGEMVICPESHALLHPMITSPCASPNHSPSKVPKFKLHVQTTGLATCTCTRVANGYYRVDATSQSHSSTTASKRASRTKAKLDMSVAMDEAFVTDSKLIESIDDDAEFAHNAAKSLVVNRVLHQLSTDPASPTSVTVADDKSQSFTQAEHSRLKTLFLKWLSTCLSDDLIRHAHHVVRDEVTLKNIPRINVLRSQVDSLLKRGASGAHTPTTISGTPHHLQAQALSPANRGQSFIMTANHRQP
eukprot:gene39918-49340_t